MSGSDTSSTSPGSATQAIETGAHPVRLQRMSLVISRGPNAGKRVLIDRDRFVVGKDPACDLTFPDPTVSRRHFEIRRQQDSYVLRDLGSTNGTVIDGTRVKEAFVKPGALIAAGNAELVLQPVYEAPGSDLPECEQFGDLIAASPPMKKILGLLRKAARAGTTVLLRGQTGVGKSALAKAVHQQGPRAHKPFVVFDCASVPPTLMESELFGANKGAFTGAVQSRPGACEQAQGGTLFLDEIGDLPLDLQPKLLRVLEEKQVRRLGSTKLVNLDLQIVAATKHDLFRQGKEGRFRMDLYYRLAVIDIEIPPLRDRTEDIPLLCDHFLEETKGPHTWSRLTPALKEQLSNYAWPGNLRELRNVLERLQCIGPDGSLVAEDLEMANGRNQALAFLMDRPFKQAKEDLIDAFEREYIERLLLRSGGRIAPAAREAGLNRKYFYDLLKKHGLHGRKE